MRILGRGQFYFSFFVGSFIVELDVFFFLQLEEDFDCCLVLQKFEILEQGFLRVVVYLRVFEKYVEFYFGDCGVISGEEFGYVGLFLNISDDFNMQLEV